MCRCILGTVIFLVFAFCLLELVPPVPPETTHSGAYITLQTCFFFSNTLNDILSAPFRSAAPPPKDPGFLHLHQVSVGYDHICGIKKRDADNNGSTICWGSNSFGQRGSGVSLPYTTASDVLNRETFAEISAGVAHTCGVTTKGRGFCWGSNLHKQLGIIESFQQSETPLPVSGEGKWLHVYSGGWSTCGITADRKGQCWGRSQEMDKNEELLNRNNGPVPLLGGSRWQQIAVGAYHSCGILSKDDALFCWGRNKEGQVGVGTSDAYISTPSEVVIGRTRFLKISVGEDHTCVLTFYNSAKCWGSNAHAQLGVAAPKGLSAPRDGSARRTWKDISAGSFYTCGVTVAGTGYCWGYDQGQLGHGLNFRAAIRTPTKIHGDIEWKSISAGHDTTCGIASDDVTWCWGYGVKSRIPRAVHYPRIVPGTIVEPKVEKELKAELPPPETEKEPEEAPTPSVNGTDPAPPLSAREEEPPHRTLASTNGILFTICIAFCTIIVWEFLKGTSLTTMVLAARRRWDNFAERFIPLDRDLLVHMVRLQLGRLIYLSENVWAAMHPYLLHLLDVLKLNWNHVLNRVAIAIPLLATWADNTKQYVFEIYATHVLPKINHVRAVTGNLWHEVSPWFMPAYEKTSAWVRELLNRQQNQGATAISADLQSIQFSMQDVFLLGVLAEGSLGEVRIGEVKYATAALKRLLPSVPLAPVDGDPINEVPVNEIPVDDVSRPTTNDLLNEVRVLASLRHQNVALTVGFCLDPPCLATEYYALGSLAELLREGLANPAVALELTWVRRLNMAADAAAGMLYLHTREPQILHLNLKSSNLLVAKDFAIKVADIGLGGVVDYKSWFSVSDSQHLMWDAPEVLGGATPTAASDVYSFGIIMWELLTWRQLWDNTGLYHIMRTVLYGGERPPLPLNIDLPGFGPGGPPEGSFHGYVDLMHQCWAGEPESRPDFNEICRQLRALTRPG